MASSASRVGGPSRFLVNPMLEVHFGKSTWRFATSAGVLRFTVVTVLAL